ncbi:Flavin-binding monooxygenase [Aspergillus sclerotialis]|uniref:Flavin-binding monooxygenase n=1 Tax=Aspergillus sclerotialis TaxID=2070753 RepID=A0A3A2ZTD0_9EURO|nr:Flavin-binding monooxygenase [Aspergillus sclerotialis]
MSPVTKEKNDLIVVGAGWFGLAAAKHYIQLHPSDRVAVVESASSCGGTWAEHRLYPGLKSNNMVGSYEYPDFPMSEAIYGVKPNDHIPAATLHQYLTDYAKHFDVFNRIAFNSSVDTIEKERDSGWRVHILSKQGPAVIETKRLVLATGLTSLPNIPTYPGQESFNAPFFHAKDFCSRADTLASSKNVTVIGGAKSAYDVSFAYVQAGVTVDLIIRPDGNGPVWLSPPFVTPLKRKMEELLHTRCLTWFSPSPWGDEDGFSLPRTFLHGTKIGQVLVHNFWHALSSDIIEMNGYDDHRSPSLAALKPWTSAFWTGSGVSIHNFDSDLHDLVKQGKIRVHIANITHLTPGQVHLSTGKSLNSDAIICATGWKKAPSFQFSNWDARICRSDTDMDKLAKAADDEILSRFPILKSQPPLRGERKPSMPIRLYHFMVPPALWEDQTLAFAGMISSVSTSICASLQGLWISAYFDGKLDRSPNEAQVVQEAVINSQWGRWRYPCGYGGDVADFAFDAIPYFDVLLRDLGLKNHRKASPMAEITDPYKPWDYKDVVEEWIAHKCTNGVNKSEKVVNGALPN